ncbi:ABC transporter substrate-binding protein [Cohnella nanjingensis]|uniref:Extracellular solute-binding protein n=1 Tax=Cohnella nanjingensis TaxID=1387779 RepID=A0A7X0VFC0_9BACL|nr:extracellular solute-binding protein [Cohnella nanjingensis]MBB6670449.1 extracellular solute-binding protein [Cohnella nanjingensis]
MVKLRGMTWNHVRGYAPLTAATEKFRESHPGVEISWDRRSLKDFGDYPVDRLAREYDILLIDHPHVGISASQNVLVPLDENIPASYLRDQEENSVGPSHVSYRWDERQWALAVDAAAQVASYRPDLMNERDVPRTWRHALDLAKRSAGASGSRVGWPLCPTDAMCSFLSLCAGIDGPRFFDESGGIESSVGEAAIDLIFELLPYLHPSSLDSNPIQLYDRMASGDEIAYVPCAFGYTNYARPGFAASLLRFADIPAISREPRGSLLGGVGIAVSALSSHVPLAVEFAMFAASGDVQRTLYVENGGQPGHAAAWRDAEANERCGGFFESTLRTMELSYMRPRNKAFPEFQEKAGIVLHGAIKRRAAGDSISPAAVAEAMNSLYRQCLSSGKSH